MRSLLLAGLLISVLLASCGGSREKDGLRAYEGAVEDLMGEEGRVAARLSEIRKDFLAANASDDADARFAKETALPFFHRFRDRAAAVTAAEPKLADVHRTLLEYLDRRIAYLEAAEAFIAATKAPEIGRFEESQAPRQAAQTDLKEKAVGRTPEKDVVDAIGVSQLFIQRIFGPFQAGQKPREDVEKALREEVMPRLDRVAERTKGSLEAPGFEGAVARWALAEQAFFRDLAAFLPVQESLQKGYTVAEEAWNQSQDLRAKFLDGLKAYRESLR